MKSVILGSVKDNVVTCCAPVVKGDVISANGVTVIATDTIPIYHKMAIAPVKTGDPVFKYGQPIGVASRDILPGQHVHVQNLESDRGRGDREGKKAK